MMTDAVKPERVTKPIQLLAAWLAGLLAINTCFLVAASRMSADSWERGALVLAAIGNVPIFLLAVFVLQTKFRPEMQEDSYYATYLNSKTNERVTQSKEDAHLALIAQRVSLIESRLASSAQQGLAIDPAIERLSIGVNSFLADKAEIEQHLDSIGVAGYSEFAGEEPPSVRTVAISQYLPEETRNAVLRIARALRFKHYNIFDNVAEEIEEDVLFGSYGGPLRKIIGSA